LLVKSKQIYGKKERKKERKTADSRRVATAAKLAVACDKNHGILIF
jgi:hypothetical protein